MGSYTMTQVEQGNRPVYVSASDQYLYYWGEYDAWRIGPDYTVEPAGVISGTGEGPACPHQVTAGTWYEYNNWAWLQNTDIIVQSQAAPGKAGHEQTLSNA